MSQTPQFDSGGTDDQPRDELDVYHDATRPTATVDEFLEQNNLGLGFYKSDSELYQQVERFHDGMYASAAFKRKILRRAVEETKRELALRGEQFYDERDMDVVTVTGWADLDESEQAETSRREFLDETGEDIWQRMSNSQRVEALEIVTGIDREWSPPHVRILMAQHELTRSRDARTLDNLFGRIEKLITRSEDGDGGSLLGGSS